MTIWFNGSEECFKRVGGPHFYLLWRGLKKHFNGLRFGEKPHFDLLNEVGLLKADIMSREKSLSSFNISSNFAGLIALLNDIDENLRKLLNLNNETEFIVLRENIEKKITSFRDLVVFAGEDLKEKLMVIPGSRRRLLKGAAVTAGVAAAAGAIKLLKSLGPFPAQEPKTPFGQSFFRQLPKKGDIKSKDLNSLEEGKDYEIRIREGEYPVLVFAPHGGLIEPGTELLASYLAGSPHMGIPPYYYYAFIVRIKFFRQATNSSGKMLWLFIQICDRDRNFSAPTFLDQ